VYLSFFIIGVGFVALLLTVGEPFLGLERFRLSFLSPITIAVFLTVTGGLGMILSPQMEFFIGGGLIAFGISAFGGVIVAAAIDRFLIIPLYKAQNTSSFNIQDTIGTTATVISPIPQGGYGKIRYNISGAVVTSPAKSDDGNQIKSGEQVTIIYVQKSTYFVKRVADGALNMQVAIGEADNI